ncbi:MAG: gliding motility-associated C-terminal domain-containing protein [Algicola sp.]|nr:gliding motility-associated C-terminal domain-containing protein [Algicola sp.]
MDKITFVRLKNRLVQKAILAMGILVFGLAPSFSAANINGFTFSLGLDTDNGQANQPHGTGFQPDSLWNPLSIFQSNQDCDGDGVTCEQENIDGTDPNDPCDFILEHQNCAPSQNWKNSDCDGDGVTNGKEKEDGTDPLDPCDFILEHQNCSIPNTWKNMDCDGDGVTNGKEKEDGTDPLDPCDFILEHQNCSPSQEWKNMDCDGDGVTNGKEKEDGTDPLDPCDFILEHQNCSPSQEWKNLDCDGDGVTNGDEKEDGTDPLDPCDYNPESITLPQSANWDALDCDDDGNPNETDPNPLTANAKDDFGSTSAITEVAINILENDDFLPNNAPNNVGVTNISRIGGDATGTVSFNNETGFVNYTPIESESNSTVTIVYQVCNVLPDPSVCATATIYIEIGANTLDAVDDTYTVGVGNGGTIPNSNVLTNDTYNGGSVTLADVVLTSTPTDQLIINADGTVEVVSGTEAGTYTIEYTICDVMDVNNCDTATVTVEISQGTGNSIDAADDTFTAEVGEDGTIPNSNVLTNDTYNGGSVTLADVVLTSTPTDQLIINADGTVEVVSGTEAGTYTIEYTICDVMDVNNCDTATVTVEVVEGADNVIDAVDDTYNTGIGGGVIANGNVLSNDTLNDGSISIIDVILTSTPTNELSIEDDGSIRVFPNTPIGTYTIEYTICEAANQNNCDTATVTVIVEEIEVNQMLTPNGDLKNDFLFIRGVEYIKSSTLKIFNRWGTQVFESANYDNVSNVFDGRVRGKSALSVNDYLPAGVYFYIFNYETAQGSFTDSEYIYISR